jgi:DNA polymerase I-like protein with 3'-5' exonuclease and polymerase domains
MEMKKITEAVDQHSLLGTKAWRAVYEHRYKRTGESKWNTLAQSYVMDQSTDDKKKERDKFKNSAGLFPVLYGCNANKVAATAQVTNAEGQVMIDVIKSHAPLAGKFLDGKSKEASTLGYVEHNSRSHSRRAFSKVMDSLKYGFPLSKSDKIDAEMQGRNTAIQGTGSDVMKEAIAMVDLWNTLYKQDIQFVLSNYDEGVWSFPENKAEQYSKVVVHFMKAAAKNYLIKEVEMDVEFHLEKTWTK